MPQTEDALTSCGHLDLVQTVTPSSVVGCSHCLLTGGRWVHLRLCLTCGTVGCCDSSPGQHAARHASAYEHPLVASFEPGERWVWCYIDQLALVIEGVEPPNRSSTCRYSVVTARQARRLRSSG